MPEFGGIGITLRRGMLTCPKRKRKEEEEDTVMKFSEAVKWLISRNKQLYVFYLLFFRPCLAAYCNVITSFEFLRHL